MTDNDFMPIRWEYPLFIIGNADGVVAVDYEGYTCCLLYKQKELAELYIEQVTLSGGGKYHPIEILTPCDFRDGLSSITPQGIEHVIWDATLRPSVCKVVAIDDLLMLLSKEPSSSE